MESSMSWQTILEKVGRVKRVCPILKKGTVPAKLMIMDSSCSLQKTIMIWKVPNIRCFYGIYLTCYSRVHGFNLFTIHIVTQITYIYVSNGLIIMKLAKISIFLTNKSQAV